MVEYCLLGYLIGSIPFGLILTYLCTKKDVRQSGSGNIGATNVLRVAGRKLALFTLILDFTKSFIIVSLAKHYASESDALLIMLSAVLGHIFPIWLRFKGGKGVATALGSYFAYNLFLGLIAVFIWLLIFVISRYSSVSSIFTAIIMPITPLIFEVDNRIMVSSALLIVSLLVILRHYENILRLINRCENKVNSQK